MHARFCTVLALVAATASAAERAGYDASGRLIVLLRDAEDFEVQSGIAAVLPSAKRVPLPGRREGGRNAVKDRQKNTWSAALELPDGARGKMEWEWAESEGGVRYTNHLTTETPFDVDALEFVLTLPRAALLNGSMTPGGATAVTFGATKPAAPALWEGDTASVQLRDAGAVSTLDVTLDQPRRVRLVDRWDAGGRFYEVRVAMARGYQAANTALSLTATLRLTTAAPAPAPARLMLDTAKPAFRFDGFGGNYCWNNASPIAAYTLDNLKLAWARSEMKLQQWDRQRDNPGVELRADWETMRRFQKTGVPYVISIWWLPERFYTDPYEKPRMAHFRLVKPEKWDELLELIGSYLQYAKKEYGVEPDLFSFNEANIGVYVGLTPETHTEAIKRIGAYFQKTGLKTRLLLGDATGPRDTHKFVLEAAADPEALRYVGAIGFHSWGGGTAEQYRAWGEVAEWLNLPLLVTELGVDAAAYNNRTWDSYFYGLREARMIQELLLYAHPQGTQYWQFTNDYALARMRENTVEPLPRFWLMKHFTDLTPQKSDGLATNSDQHAVLFTAFRKAGAYTLHVLNLGPARTVTIEGVPNGDWQATTSTEAAQFARNPAGQSAGGKLSMTVAARSLVTLTTQTPAR